MSLLNPTPRAAMLDALGRPYFLWDADMTLSRFEDLLRTGDRATRVYLIAKLMRQAKPDDVFEFVSLANIAELWPDLDRDLGTAESFWRWLLRSWQVIP